MAMENPLITPSQIRAARALLDWSQGQLAKAAGVSLTTIRDYENERRSAREDDGPNGSGRVVGGLGTIRRTLENEGIRLLPSEGDYGPGVRIIARMPNVLRWPTKLGEWEPLLVPVEWRGQAVNVFVSHEVLEDLGQFRESQPDAEYLRVYEEHRADILQAAAAAIDAGRMTPDRRVHLTGDDFAQLR
jgi:DNA-binding XRE family transcriptional regulator